ncbi:MAG: N-acetyltransferase [Chitinophagaceae bacterium]|nr:MAG: N-acetyltransferase [Chitinophagaceae bacterium]
MKVKTPIIETERLQLVPLGINHLSSVYVNWMNDPEVNAYLESGGDYTLDKLNEFLLNVEKSSILFWAIHIKENGKHIGNIKIDPINFRHKYGEYGIMMGEKKEWGKGYAKEASLSVIMYCFSKDIDLRKVNLGVRSNNESAVQLYKKLGFTVEGVYKKHVITKLGYDDILRMALFNPIYEQ